MVRFEELFKRLHEVNMKIHPKKCEFVVTSIVYFGHKNLPNSIMVHWAKVIVTTLTLACDQSKRVSRAWAKKSVKMKIHSQVNSPLGVRILVDSQTFREQLQRSKHLALKSFLYH